MLANKRVAILGDTVVNDAKIASYGATLNIETGELSLTSRNIDAEACKIHKNIVRADRAEFEDYAYMVQDALVPSKTN